MYNVQYFFARLLDKARELRNKEFLSRNLDQETIHALSAINKRENNNAPTTCLREKSQFVSGKKKNLQNADH